MAQFAKNRPAFQFNENDEANKEVSDSFVDIRELPVRTNPNLLRCIFCDAKLYLFLFSSLIYSILKSTKAHLNHTKPGFAMLDYACLYCLYCLNCLIYSYCTRCDKVCNGKFEVKKHIRNNM